jgi:hypothetical protein
VLSGTNPLVWRRIQVPEKYSFWDLHVAVQDALGWPDYHLHEFRLLDAAEQKVVSIGIPTDWQHVLVHEGYESFDDDRKYPCCVAGEGRCPPEDCGGVHGYAEFLRVIADPDHEEHESTLERAGGQFDPEAFDPAAVKFDDSKKRRKKAFER